MELSRQRLRQFAFPHFVHDLHLRSFTCICLHNHWFTEAFLQVPLRRTLTFKQVAETIQTVSNVREIEELTFSHIHISSQKKSRKINVLKDQQRDFRLKDMRQRATTPQGEKDDFWEFFDRDCPENFYSIEYNLKAT